MKPGLLILSLSMGMIFYQPSLAASRWTIQELVQAGIMAWDFGDSAGVADAQDAFIDLNQGCSVQELPFDRLDEVMTSRSKDQYSVWTNLKEPKDSQRKAGALPQILLLPELHNQNLGSVIIADGEGGIKVGSNDITAELEAVFFSSAYQAAVSQLAKQRRVFLSVETPWYSLNHSKEDSDSSASIMVLDRASEEKFGLVNFGKNEIEILTRPLERLETHRKLAESEALAQYARESVGRGAHLPDFMLPLEFLNSFAIRGSDTPGLFIEQNTLHFLKKMRSSDEIQAELQKSGKNWEDAAHAVADAIQSQIGPDVDAEEKKFAQELVASVRSYAKLGKSGALEVEFLDQRFNSICETRSREMALNTIKQIKAMRLGSNDLVLMNFGAGHLNGIVKVLKAQGYPLAIGVPVRSP